MEFFVNIFDKRFKNWQYSTNLYTMVLLLQQTGTIDMDTLNTLQKNYGHTSDFIITNLLKSKEIVILIKIRNKSGLYEISGKVLEDILTSPRNTDFLVHNGFIGPKRDDFVKYKTVTVLVKSFLDFHPTIAEVFDQLSKVDIRTAKAISLDLDSKKDLEDDPRTGSTFQVNAHLYIKNKDKKKKKPLKK